jgi:hypothetical protein
MQLNNIDGEEVIWASKMYKEPPRSSLQLIKSIGKSPIYYALTKSKAYIIKGDNKIIQSCDVSNASVSIVNRIKVTPSNISARYRSHGQLMEVGTIIFMYAGRVLIDFVDVENPDLVVKIFETKRKSEEKSKISSPPSQKEIDTPNSSNEIELWRYGPVLENKDNLFNLKVDSMGYFKIVTHQLKGRIKAIYIVTNKKAKIVSKDETEIYFEVNLNECDITVTNKNKLPTKIQTIWDKNKNYQIFGDVIFIKEGKPVMMFKSVPDPDSLLDIINKNIRQQNFS